MLRPQLIKDEAPIMRKFGYITRLIYHEQSSPGHYAQNMKPCWLKQKQAEYSRTQYIAGRSVPRLFNQHTWTVNRGDGGSIPTATVLKLRQFRSPHICLCLSEETLKSRWSLLAGVYARGSKRSHTGGKCVTCRGHTNSRKGQL